VGGCVTMIAAFLADNLLSPNRSPIFPGFMIRKSQPPSTRP
jgi:hypothetical protein